MLEQFALVLVFAIVGVLFLFGTLFAGRFFRPKNPTQVKKEAYECGEPAVGPAWINFNMRFYLIALIFVIFDVEVALVVPVAVVFKSQIAAGSGFVALAEIGVFIMILLIGLAYVWAKRDLEWIKKI